MRICKVGYNSGAKMTQYSYRVTGIIDSWKLISENIKARTEKEAKSKLRRRYKKIQSVHVRAITETKPVAITPRQRQQLKSQLAERTKIRRRKEDERRQHIYK